MDVRSDTGQSVGRVDGRSIEQIRVAVGRTVRTADGRTCRQSEKAGGPTVDGRTCRQSEGRSGGRSNEVGHDQSQGSLADRTPDRAIEKSKEREEQTPTDVLCAWMQRSAAPAGQFRDGGQPSGGHFRLLRG